MASREGKLRDLSAREEQRKLSKAELLRPRKVVEETFINSLGGTITLQSLSHGRRQEIRQAAGFDTPEFDEDKFTMLSIVASIVDPEMTLDDLQALHDQDASVIDELIVKISVLNLLGRTEDLKKESEPIQSLDSV